MAENVNNDATPESTKGETVENSDSNETLEITLKKDSNEAVLKSSKDKRVVILKGDPSDTPAVLAEAIKELTEEEEDAPLTPEDFEEALKKVDALGYTFTAELFPSIVPKDKTTSLISNDEFKELEEKYPTLPRELGIIVYSILTDGTALIGGIEGFEKKSDIVNKIILTDDFRAEFYFNHALKVPYLENIDWEVILKTHEHGVKGVVNVPYALLMLTFHNTNPRIGKLDIHKNITVAVNKLLIDKILATLTDVRISLEESEKMRDILNNKSLE